MSGVNHEQDPEYLRLLDEVDNAPEFSTAAWQWKSDLESVERFSQVDLIHPESLFTHVSRVESLAMLLASSLSMNNTEDVNLLKVSRLASHHDDAEVETSDIPTPVKRAMTDEEKKKLKDDELTAAKLLAQRYAPPRYRDQYIADHIEVSEKRTIEAQVVDVADKWDGLCKTILEIQCGNTGMSEILHNYRIILAELSKHPVFAHFTNPEDDFQQWLSDERINALPKLSRELLEEDPEAFWEIVYRSKAPSLYTTWLSLSLHKIEAVKMFSGWRDKLPRGFHNV